MKNLKKLFASVASIAILASVVPVSVLGAASYSDELQEAYDYAYNVGITTQSSIDAANMYGTLTRAHMAKMMVNFAKEVFNQEPDTSKECNFSDLAGQTQEMKGYIEESCQLGLMGVGITAFNPNGAVTRAQFGTVLSRVIRGDENEGGDPYYAKHLEALKDAGIMTNISNPMANEIRGYVMLMMMRADNDAETPAICETPENQTACSLGLDTCPEECIDEEDEVDETKSGELSVDVSSNTPKEELPIGATQAISRVALLTFDVEAGDEDVDLHSADIEFLGYGDYADVDNVTIYNEDNVKISKEKNFTSEEMTVNFVNDYTVKAGETQTLTVAVELATTAEANTTYGVAITDLDTSAETVDGLPLNGNKMKAVVVTNQTVLDFSKSDAVTDTVTVGEEKKLAAFSLQNDDNYEDVTINTITLQVDGVDGDIFDNLTLYADGEEIASDLEILNDELVANVDLVLEKDSAAVDFELKGSANELDTDDAIFSLENRDAIYAIGNKYGFNVTSNLVAGDVVGKIEIEGSEVATSFDKSDVTEAKIEAEDVLLGTLKMKSAATDYTINSYSICVSNVEVISSEIKDLTLGGNSYDNMIAEASTDACAAGYDEYVFEDISLPAGKEVKLQLVADFEDTVDEDDDVSFNVSFNQNIDVTDEDNDEDYTEANISTIFSTVSFTQKSLTIQGPTFDLVKTTLNPRTVVLGNQEELVYKGKVSIGDADTVKLKSIKFNDAGTADLTDVLQSATLSIDGKEYDDTSIEAGRINFNNINHVFTAGQSNVVVELSVTLKTDDLAGVDKTLILSTAEADVNVVDSEGDTLDPANVAVANTSSATLTLTEEGALTITFEKDDESSTSMNNFTEQTKYALAGSSAKVLLAKVKLKADREDMKIEKLTFVGNDVNGDFYNSYDNLYFSLDAGTTSIGSVDVTYNTDVTTIEYTFGSASFTVSKSTPKYAYLYATVKAHDEDVNATEEGGIDGATLADLDVTAVEYKGLSSDLDEVDLTETLPTDTAEDTIVVVNTIGNVKLEQVAKTLTVGTHVIGKLVVTPTSQSTNKDADGDVINALIGNLNLDRAASDCTVTSVSIRKVGGSVAAVALTDNTATDISGLGVDAEIKGTTTYELVAVVSAVVDSADAAVQLLVDDVTADVDFLSMTAGTALNYLLPTGVSKELTVSTK